MQLELIRGINKKVEKQLNKVGITNVEKLLSACALRKNRAAIAKETGIEEALILEWTNRADLARIKGVAGKYAELLEEAGVDTIPEMALRNPENLIIKLKEINDAKKIVQQLPSLSQVKDWIKQANELPRIIHY